MIKSFFIKLAALAVLLLGAQVAVSTLFPPALPVEIERLQRGLAAGADIIFLGDSTLTHPEGEITTGEILQEQIPEHRIAQVAHPAYQLDLYRAYADYLVRQPHQPEFVIIPINLRAFSPEWDLRPGYQFEQEQMILRYGLPLARTFYRPLAALRDFEPAISQETFLSTTVFNGDTPAGQVADYERLLGNGVFDTQATDVEFAYYSRLPSAAETEALESAFVYYFMYDLPATHRKILSMLALSRQLKAHGIQPIFYVTPLNYELGEQVLGDDFSRHIKKNVALIAGVLRAEKLELLDLSFDLAAFNFLDTEHLTENGKTYVAQRLAAVIDPGPPLQPLAASEPDAVEAPAISRVLTPTSSQQAVPGQSEPTNRRPTAAVQAINTATATPTATARPATPAPTPTATADSIAASPTVARLVDPTATATPGPGVLTAVEFLGDFEPVGNYPVEIYQLHYDTLNEADEPIEVRANLYLPQVDETTEFPVLVYNVGTTGLGPNCAPLDELAQRRNWGSYHYQMLEYAAQGFIVVWPEGAGYSDGEPVVPYFIADYQGRIMLDAVRATYRFFSEQAPASTQTEPMEAVFVGGYSSGGHAAFAAKDLAPSYAPELPLTGVIGHGPTTNAETLLKENAIFTPYLVYAYQAFYGNDVVDPNRVLGDNILGSFETSMMTRCVDDIYNVYSFSGRVMYRPEFRAALTEDRLRGYLPRFKQLLDLNASGLAADGADVPILILQGTADLIITPPSQLAFVQALCELDNAVTYLTYRAAAHADTRFRSFRDTVAWMRSLAAAETVESSCAELAAS